MTLAPRLLARTVVLAAATCWASAPSVAADKPPADAAAEAYGRGDFAEARRLLEQIDATGAASPAQLYQLYFAQRSTGAAEAPATLERARVALDRAWSEKPDLENGFYLSNAYQSAGNKAEATRVATEVVSRLDSKELTATSGVDQFRAGMLYATVGNDLEAASRLRGAVAVLEQQASTENDGYIAWASRWLGERALAAADWSAAEIHLSSYVEHAKPTAADYDQLAMARVRNGMYTDAAAAWKAAIPLDRANSDRARYSASLAAAAARFETLPLQGPSTKPFREMNRTELEQFMSEEARAVRQIRADAEASGAAKDPERRKEVHGQLAARRPAFVAAGLEYTARGWSMQEAAFVGGFAPLVFRNAEWKLPRIEAADAAETSPAPEATDGDDD